MKATERAKEQMKERAARLTDEQKEARRQQIKMYQRLRRAAMAPEEKAAELETRRARRKADPAKHLCAELRRIYGITFEQYEEMWERQGRACALCTTPLVLAGSAGQKRGGIANVDHCHATGKVRGLLCNWCNRGLGLFKDNPAVLVKASAYLKGAL